MLGDLPSAVFVTLNRQHELLVSTAVAFSVTNKTFIVSANAYTLEYHHENNIKQCYERRFIFCFIITT